MTAYGENLTSADTHYGLAMLNPTDNSSWLRLERRLPRGATLLTFSTFGSTGISAVATLVVARTSGPEVRGALALGLLWTVVCVTLGLKGSSLAAATAILAQLSPTETRNAFEQKRPVILRCVGISVLVFGGWSVHGEMPVFEGLLFVCIAGWISINNWYERVLRACPEINAFCWYRLVTNVVPQTAQILAVSFGMTSLRQLLTSFLVGLCVAHILGIRIASEQLAYLRGRMGQLDPVYIAKKRTTRPGFHFVATLGGLGQTFLPRIDLFFLSFVSTRGSVGIYSIAVSTTFVGSMLPYILGVAQFRKGAINSHKAPHLRKSAFALAAQACFGALVSVSILIPLAGTEYSEARVPALILFAGTVPTGIVNIYAERWRGAARNNWVLIAQLISAATTVSLLLVFGRDGELWSIAGSSTMGSLAAALWVTRIIKKEAKVFQNRGNLLSR